MESFERCNGWWIKEPNVIPRAVSWSRVSIFKRSDIPYVFGKVILIGCLKLLEIF